MEAPISKISVGVAGTAGKPPDTAVGTSGLIGVGAGTGTPGISGASGKSGIPGTSGISGTSGTVPTVESLHSMPLSQDVQLLLVRPLIDVETQWELPAQKFVHSAEVVTGTLAQVIIAAEVWRLARRIATAHAVIVVVVLVKERIMLTWQVVFLWNEETFLRVSIL